MDEIRTILRGLDIGAEFATGQDLVRVVSARKALQNLTTGRFVSPSAAIPAYTRAVTDRIMQYIASEVALLLEKNLEYFTGTQYKTLRQLAGMGHPYARRHFDGRFSAGRPGIPAGGPQFVNAQQYRGAGSSLSFNFNFDTSRSPNGLWKVVAFNPLLHAGLLVTGTNSMIARPYDRAAVERTKRQSTAVINKAAGALVAAGLPGSIAKMPEIDFVLGNVRRQYQ